MSALNALDKPAKAALFAEIARRRRVRRKRELLGEGSPIARPMLLLAGWAARTRVFEDGRLQILSFVLPGDLIGNCRHAWPIAASTVIALTDIEYCMAPPPAVSSALAEAYAISHALDEAYLLSQIARLGRLTAEERLADLLLELLERQLLCGLVTPSGGFAMPLTQQMLADATGLTVVHVNRMLRQLRRQDDVVWQDGVLAIGDPASLAARIGRAVTRVSASSRPATGVLL